MSLFKTLLRKLLATLAFATLIAASSNRPAHATVDITVGVSNTQAYASTGIPDFYGYDFVYYVDDPAHSWYLEICTWRPNYMPTSQTDTANMAPKIIDTGNDRNGGKQVMYDTLSLYFGQWNSRVPNSQGAYTYHTRDYNPVPSIPMMECYSGVSIYSLN